MQWVPRLKPWRVRQLYQCIRHGIFDEDKLLHIGWGLYARGEAVLMFGQAMRGQVPCPQCDQIVYRRNFYRQRPSAQPSTSQFSCPICAEKVTWRDCRDALRNHPRCFDCRKILAWNYSTNTLTCSSCKQIWTWQKYRQSIKYRVRLPCPHCSNTLRKPPSSKSGSFNKKKASSHWDLTCPNCKRQGQHMSGVFCCTHCGYEKKWQAFTKRQKRKVEYLNCAACGHAFTWQSWKKQYDRYAHTGNLAPIRQFVSQWPRCKTPGEQLIAIDRLIHALHARGSLAPVFIQGNQHSVAQWLDDLALK